MARRASVCGTNDPNGIPVYSRKNYRKFRNLIGRMVSEEGAGDPHVFIAHLRTIRDRLSNFLEDIDRCDVLFGEKKGDRLVFIVLADHSDHLPLIGDEIVRAKSLLNELGINPGEVDVRGAFIRIDLPTPEAGSSVCH